MSIITGFFGFIIHAIDGLFGFLGGHAVIFALAAGIAYLAVIHFHLLSKLEALEKSVTAAGDSVWAKVHADANNIAEFIEGLISTLEKDLGVNKGTPTPPAK